MLYAKLALVAAMTVIAVSADDCLKQYSVAPGDTCFSIAAANKVPTNQILVLNPGIGDCTHLIGGQILCLADAKHNCQNVHTVVNGDDCNKVASAAGITVAELIKENPQINADCTNMKIGDTLCVDKAT